jgi:hypothetical protein
MAERIRNKAFGVDNISVKEYRRIGLVHLIDELVMRFDKYECHDYVSKQHMRALKEDLYTLRNGCAERAGTKTLKLRN